MTRQSTDSAWALSIDLLSAKALVWIASVGTDAELTHEAHIYFFDRYNRLADCDRRRGRLKKADRLKAKAEEHYRPGGGADGPPYAAAMAMPRPGRFIRTNAVSPNRSPDPMMLRRHVASLLMLGVMLGATTVAAGPGSRPAPRVFVFTVEAKDAVKTEEEQGRLDSVRDMREALSHNSKIVLVSEASAAQVLVEVTGREKREAPVGGFGGTVVTPLVETIVRLHVKFGDHETEIKGVGKAYWARAAKDAADRLVKWITRMAAMPARVVPVATAMWVLYLFPLT